MVCPYRLRLPYRLVTYLNDQRYVLPTRLSRPSPTAVTRKHVQLHARSSPTKLGYLPAGRFLVRTFRRETCGGFCAFPYVLPSEAAFAPDTR